MRAIAPALVVIDNSDGDAPRTADDAPRPTDTAPDFEFK